MNFIYYSRTANSVGKRIQEIVELQFKGEEIESYRDTESLTRRLCRPVGTETIALLVAESARGLEDLLAIGPFVSDIRIILILPDREQEDRARKILQPRFVSYLGNEYLYVEIASVLKSMQEIIFLYRQAPVVPRRFKLLHMIGLH